MGQLYVLKNNKPKAGLRVSVNSLKPLAVVAPGMTTSYSVLKAIRAFTLAG